MRQVNQHMPVIKLEYSKVLNRRIAHFWDKSGPDWDGVDEIKDIV